MVDIRNPFSIFARHVLSGLVCCCGILATAPVFATLQQSATATRPDFESDIVPFLEQYCYDCHGYGATEGGLALDQFETDNEAVQKPQLWWRVVKNLRSSVMPPPDSIQPSEEEVQRLKQWITLGPFGIDPANPDPGPVAVKRINREQYGNTVRELMGIRFNEKLIFPPDDSGHGFDNVADAMTVSPLLLDKYLQAAELIVDRAVPKVCWIIPRQQLDGSDFRPVDGDRRVSGRWLNGKVDATVQRQVAVEEAGTYKVQIEIRQHGSFEFDPARYVVTCKIDGDQRFSEELGWDENKPTIFTYREDWSAGKHSISFNVQPVVSKSADDQAMLDRDDGTSVSLEIDSVLIEGPLGTSRRVHPANYERFFTRRSPPEAPAAKREYAEEVLRKFAARAFRGKVDQVSIERLVDIAESIYSRPDTTFEEGIRRAMVAVLVSPRFLFRIESTMPVDGEAPYGLVDEFSLASRLSYFLWSSMPDDELFELASAGQLRAQLGAQVDRMLRDPRSDALVANFVGQWLRTRDIQNSSVDAAAVLGVAEEYHELRDWLRSRFRRGRWRGEMSEEDRRKFDRFREIRGQLDRVNDDLKRAMQRETELLVQHIVRSDASLLDVLDCDYTFLNEDLARHYGIEGVTGREMRRVQLPADSPRGGVLTHASMLMVTSNPTRTSPVKRGLFVLDNILGTPAPPAPAAVPELEESETEFAGRKPSLRELLEVHRENSLCASCHARMDPIGLALENFNALGMWRERDGENEIAPQGQLVTGETFSDIRSLKRLLREKHADAFYRCIAEKLLVFAVGRGVEYSDEYTIDQIVRRLEESDGSFRTLVQAIVESAPFQKQRVPHAQPDMPKAARIEDSTRLNPEGDHGGS